MDEKTVNQRLVELIHTKSRSEKAFAELIGVSQTSLNNYVRLNRVPSLEFIITLFRALPDVSPDWLLLGEGSMYRAQAPQSQDIVLDNTNIIQRGKTNINASRGVTIQDTDNRDTIIQRLLDQNQQLLKMIVPK